MHDLKVAENFRNEFPQRSGMLSRVFPIKLFEPAGIILILVAILFWGGVHATENPKGSKSEAPKVSPVSRTGYELQLNSFKVKSNAKRFFDTLVEKGYEPFMVFVQKEDIWFKVRLGPYPSTEAAQRIAAEIKQKHGFPSLVLLAGKIQSRPNKVSKTSSKRVAPENAGNSIDVVMSQFLMWLKAWQSKQLDSYFSFYSRSFKSGGKPFKDWQKAQSKSLDEIKKIRVEVNDLELLEKEDTIEMSFIESFKSNSFSDVRRKVLVWKKEKGVWRIIVESSEPA